MEISRSVPHLCGLLRTRAYPKGYVTKHVTNTIVYHASGRCLGHRLTARVRTRGSQPHGGRSEQAAGGRMG
jgi:hypothetical protein